MNRSCRVVAALLLLLLTGSQLWAQRPLRDLRSGDFHGMLLRELQLQRRTPTPLFQEIDPVFLLNEAAISRMVYDPATGILRWRYTVRPGVGRAVAARIARRLHSFLVGSLIRAGLVTQAQIDAGEFRVEILAEQAGLGEEVIPPGVPERGVIREDVVVPSAPPAPPQPAENAPQTVATTGSVGYTSYYPTGYGWGCPPYWGCCCCNWFDGYYCTPWWGCGYYPVAYPTVAAASPATAAVVTSAAPVSTPPMSSLSTVSRLPRGQGPTQLAAARRSHTSLYLNPGKEEALPESPSSAPTFWRQPTGADPEGLFWDGHTLYWQGRYRDALDSIEAALAERRDDARFWSYKALCEKALGQGRAANASARYARALRAQGLPAREQVCSVLERVQGADRCFLNGEEDALARR